MKSLVPEILTAEEIQAKRAWVEARYPHDIVSEIAKVAKFEGAQTISNMQSFLLDAGLWYEDHKDVRDPNASFEPDRDQLEAIAAAATKLEKLLRSMSSVSAISLWHPFQHLSLLALRMPPSGFVTDFGLTIFQRPRGDGSFTIEHLRPHQIEEAINVLQQLATHAAMALPKQMGGQRQFGPRQDWINSAGFFWHRHSSIAFDARSRAADFCYLAFQQLDSSVTEKQIKSAIRAANALYSAIKKRQKPVQESR